MAAIEVRKRCGGASGSRVASKARARGSGRWWRGRQRWAGRRIGGERGSAGTHALRAATLLTSTIVRYRPGTVRLQLGSAALPERSAFRQRMALSGPCATRPDSAVITLTTRLLVCPGVCVCVCDNVCV